MGLNIFSRRTKYVSGVEHTSLSPSYSQLPFSTIIYQSSF